jgi:hypothetical protein
MLRYLYICILVTMYVIRYVTVCTSVCLLWQDIKDFHHAHFRYDMDDPLPKKRLSLFYHNTTDISHTNTWICKISIRFSNYPEKAIHGLDLYTWTACDVKRINQMSKVFLQPVCDLLSSISWLNFFLITSMYHMTVTLTQVANY